MLAVVGRGLAFDAGDTWSHLAQTVLPRYVANTIALVLMVGAGVGIGGTVAGWLVARRRFPGSAFFAWALLLPLAMPAYVMAYAYTDFLQYAGPLQTSLREAFGWSREDYWFPDIRSVPGAAAMFVFTLYPYVFLLARTAFLERSPTLIEAARTLGLDRRARVLARRAAARASRDRRRHRARADGDARRLRHGRVLRRRHVHDRHLSRVVLARRPHGRRAAVGDAAAVRGRRRRGRARVARRGDAPTTARARAPAPRAHRRRLPGSRAWLATTVCAIPLLAGFVMPVLLLLRLVGRRRASPRGPRATASWSYNSLRVAMLAAVLAVAIAIFTAYARRLAPGMRHARERARAEPRVCAARARCSRSACCCRSARSTIVIAQRVDAR